MKFTIECEMEDRWVNDFLSMLKYMEDCGKIGRSAIVGFYSDGDGGCSLYKVVEWKEI